MLTVNVLNSETKAASFSFAFDSKKFLAATEGEEMTPELMKLQDIVARWDRQGQIKLSDNNTLTADQYTVLLDLFRVTGFAHFFLPFHEMKIVKNMSAISDAARAMGSAKSPAKAAAAIVNGKKGGRPRNDSKKTADQ